MAKAVNCSACGNEFRETELKTVQLLSLGMMSLCLNCHDKTAGQNYKDASDILKQIQKIAKEKTDPDERLNLIINLLKS